jgi:hypothetical protein
VPVLATLPDEVVGCALAGREPRDDDWLEWNLGRHRAAPLMDAPRPAPEGGGAVCAQEAGG